ncbi:MAG: M12 family metallopeptidase [Nannocystales bacterium]
MNRLYLASLCAVGALCLSPVAAGCASQENASAKEEAVEELNVEDRYDIPEGTHLAWVDFGEEPMQVAYEVDNGDAVWQGDIVLGDADEVAEASALYEENPDDPGFRSALAHTQGWPNGTIPYEIVVIGTLRDRVEDAIDDWNDQSLIQFVPRDTSNPFQKFVRFTWQPAGSNSTCSSPLGMQFGIGAQEVRLTTACGKSAILHEIGHSVGLFHEHSRTDRDSHISINWANVPAGKESQYYTYLFSGVTGLNFGAYDINSIMHYDSFMGASLANDSSVPVMVRTGCAPFDTSTGCTFFASNTLTDLDLAGVTRQVTGAPPTFKLRNEWRDLCLRPFGASRSPGARVHLSSCSNTSSRRWYTWRPPGTTRDVFVNEYSRHCLGVDENDDMLQVPCTAEFSHLFWTTTTGAGYGDRLRRMDDRCVRASTSGDRAFLSATCNNTPTRRWFRDL